MYVPTNPKTIVANRLINGNDATLKYPNRSEDVQLQHQRHTGKGFRLVDNGA